MLRIGCDVEDGDKARLRLEGKLAGPWVAELRDLSLTCLARYPLLTLDVAGVTYADAPGAALLRDLAAREVAIEGCSTFLSELLAGGDHDDDDSTEPARI